MSYPNVLGLGGYFFTCIRLRNVRFMLFWKFISLLIFKKQNLRQPFFHTLFWKIIILIQNCHISKGFSSSLFWPFLEPIGNVQTQPQQQITTSSFNFKLHELNIFMDHLQMYQLFTKLPKVLKNAKSFKLKFANYFRGCLILLIRFIKHFGIREKWSGIF